MSREPRVVRCVELRRQRGWTQAHLAAVAGVSERTVQRLERGDDVSADTVHAVAAAFDVTCAELAERPRTMFPVDEPTLRGLVARARGVVGVGVAPDAVVPATVVDDIAAALRSPGADAARRALDLARRRGLRLLATEVPAGAGAAAGVMLAPSTGSYTAAWRVGRAPRP